MEIVTLRPHQRHPWRQPPTNLPVERCLGTQLSESAKTELNLTSESTESEEQDISVDQKTVHDTGLTPEAEEVMLNLCVDIKKEFECID